MAKQKIEIDDEIAAILDGWFGESLEDAEDEEYKRKYLYEPLTVAIQNRDNEGG